MLRPDRPDAGWVNRLAEKAETLAHAAAERRLRARRDDPRRWRRAALLWPLFARNTPGDR